MIKIIDLKIPLSYDDKMLKAIAAEKLDIEPYSIESVSIKKRSIDMKNKQDIHFVMTILVSVSGKEDDIPALDTDKGVSKELKFVYNIPNWKRQKERPVVIGCGPAGLFAALILAQAGANPLLLERGSDADSRKQKVTKFWQTGVIDIDTNVQFGEGGAGTFSDGKLKLGLKDFRKMKVLREFVEAGAPPEIMYVTKPHIGTDRLLKTVKGLRKKIIGLGGEVRFNATVTEILRKNGHVTGIGFVENGNYTELDADNVVLAIGHSARDTFEKLLLSGINIQQKAFAVGVRIEHPQALIDKIQYGDFAGHPALGAADYKTVVHLKNGRSVYSFCMCPGGKVIASTSEKNSIVTNGMSEFARDGKNANCALLVSVGKKDLGSDHPLAGVAFQHRIETAAFTAAGGNYKAPVQRLEDFLQRRQSTAFGDVLPTYMPGTEFAKVDYYLPDYIADSLRESIPEIDDWMHGFYYPDALLTGAETRSSSPVCIPRDENLEAVGVKGLFPCGEGAGYAGGIISAAVDGILCAEQILNKNS